MPEIWDPQIPTGSVVSGTDYVLVGNSVNRARKVRAGSANGVATLDSSGKLAQPRRVLGAAYKAGSTGNIAFTTSPYVLPDPVLTFSVPSGSGSFVIFLEAVVSYDNISEDTNVYLTIESSTDGGATWSRVGVADIMWRGLAGKDGSVYKSDILYVPSGTTEVKARIKISKFSSTAQLTISYSNWRQMIGILMEV